MGTNFYLMSGQHIGKRSAAGMYCWDCQIKCNGEKCPNCGKIFEGNVMAEGAVAVELGFAKPYTKRQRKGVKPVSSFTWDIDPQLRVRKVVDEYGDVYSLKEFKERVLANCPIQIFTAVGRNFT